MLQDFGQTVRRMKVVDSLRIRKVEEMVQIMNVDLLKRKLGYCTDHVIAGVFTVNRTVEKVGN